MSSKMSRKSRALQRRRAQAEQARRRAARLARVESIRRAEALLHPGPAWRPTPNRTHRLACQRRAQSMSLPDRSRRRLLRLLRVVPSTMLSEHGLRVLAEIARQPWLIRPERLVRESLDAAGFLTRLLAVWPLPPFVMQALLSPHRTPLRPMDLRWVVGLAVHLGRGGSPRTMPVLSGLTHRMRATFLASSPNLAPVAALRRAQILGAGGGAALATVIRGTRLAHLQDDEVWWHDMLTWMAERRPHLIYEAGSLVRWLAALRSGGSDYDPRGRPLASVLRRMAEDLPSLTDEPDWPTSGLTGLEDAPWSLTEIDSQIGLLEEGRAMSHCVLGRRSGLAAGTNAVLSLRHDGRRVGTVEVSLAWRRLVEVKGSANRLLCGEEKAVVVRWARCEGLAMAGCAW